MPNHIGIKKQRAVAVLFMRLVLGIVFLMQGYGKVVKFGVQNVFEQFFRPYTEILPEFLVVFAAYYTSYVELIGGFFMLIGFLRFYNYLALALVLVIVSFGHGLMDPIWDLHHVFFRLFILTALIFIPLNWDKYSFDKLIINKSIR